MSKGDRTRESILDQAVLLASEVGLEGLTIGRLAEVLGMSKSGLFAHFGSKEGLQLQVLDHTAAQFARDVVEPALRLPRGAARLDALFDRWLAWGHAMPGGCLFVGAAAELDARPGPVRERLVALQRQWLGVLARSVRQGMESGLFSDVADPEQFAQDLYGVMLAHHHAYRLLDDPQSGQRARRAFAALVAALRPVPSSTGAS